MLLITVEILLRRNIDGKWAAVEEVTWGPHGAWTRVLEMDISSS